MFLDSDDYLICKPPSELSNDVTRFPYYVKARTKTFKYKNSRDKHHTYCQMTTFLKIYRHQLIPLSKKFAEVPWA